MLCGPGVEAPRNAYAVSHPSAPLEPTNKKRAIPYPFVIGYKTATGSLLEAKAKIPAICVAISFGIPHYRRRPSQAPRLLVVLGGLHTSPTLESTGSLSVRTAHHVLILPFVENHLVFRFAVSHSSFLSLVSSCRSLVRVSP